MHPPGRCVDDHNGYHPWLCYTRQLHLSVVSTALALPASLFPGKAVDVHAVLRYLLFLRCPWSPLSLVMVSLAGFWMHRSYLPGGMEPVPEHQVDRPPAAIRQLRVAYPLYVYVVVMLAVQQALFQK